MYKMLHAQVHKYINKYLEKVTSGWIFQRILWTVIYPQGDILEMELVLVKLFNEAI